VVIHTVANKTSQGEKMAFYLDKLAELGSMAHISDPVAWQKEIRLDHMD
jgi:hypothetical protein